MTPNGFTESANITCEPAGSVFISGKGLDWKEFGVLITRCENLRCLRV